MTFFSTSPLVNFDLGFQCRKSYEQNDFKTIVLSLKYERFKNFATEEFVLQNGGILCPGEGCGNGLMPEDETTRRIVCFRNRGGCGVG